MLVSSEILYRILIGACRIYNQRPDIILYRILQDPVAVGSYTVFIPGFLFSRVPKPKSVNQEI